MAGSGIPGFLLISMQPGGRLLWIRFRLAGAFSPSAGLLPAFILTLSVSIGIVLSSPRDHRAHLAAMQTSWPYLFIYFIDKIPVLPLRHCCMGAV